MALRSTVYKADLSVADIDRGYYAEHPLRIARHPSETEERMMVRLLAFAKFASDSLQFAAGLSTVDEPDLWQKDLTGAIERWIEVGLPDEKRLRRACGRAGEVAVLAYGGARADIWWTQSATALERCDNLSVWRLPSQQCAELARLADRAMVLTCSIQDEQIWIGNGDRGVSVVPEPLKVAVR